MRADLKKKGKCKPALTANGIRSSGSASQRQVEGDDCPPKRGSSALVAKAAQKTAMTVMMKRGRMATQRINASSAVAAKTALVAKSPKEEEMRRLTTRSTVTKPFQMKTTLTWWQSEASRATSPNPDDDSPDDEGAPLSPPWTKLPISGKDRKITNKQTPDVSISSSDDGRGGTCEIAFEFPPEAPSYSGSLHHAEAAAEFANHPCHSWHHNPRHGPQGRLWQGRQWRRDRRACLSGTDGRTSWVIREFHDIIDVNRVSSPTTRRYVATPMV